MLDFIVITANVVLFNALAKSKQDRILVTVFTIFVMYMLWAWI